MIARDDTPPALSEDAIDDILYAARTNDQQDLTDSLHNAAQTYSSSEQAVLLAAVAPDSHNTALHYAAANGHDALLSHILSISSDPAFVNRRNEAGNTPLHWAALNGHMASTKALITAGADMWVRNAAGNLAVFEAERAGKDDIVAYLLLEGGTEKEKEGAEAQTGEADAEEDQGEEMDEVRVTMGDMGLDGKGA